MKEMSIISVDQLISLVDRDMFFFNSKIVTYFEVRKAAQHKLPPL